MNPSSLVCYATACFAIASCSRSSSPHCSNLNATPSISPIEPIITVVNGATHAPICDATIRSVSGQYSAAPQGPSDGPPVQSLATDPMPSIMTADGGAYGLPGGIETNVLAPIAGCEYSPAPVMGPEGTYVIYVAHDGYVPQEVSNVLVLSPTDACDVEILPPPKPQVVAVTLTPVGK